MPITCPIQFKQVTTDEFHQLDYKVMQHVFASHNTLGRFCDESIYQRDLANRLADLLNPVRTEVPVTASWNGFRKTYYLDLTVCDSAVYELKAATSLVSEHEAQTLNYLFLVGLSHGKLINFRPPSVEWRFVSTSLSSQDRHAFQIRDSGWIEATPACSKLRQTIIEILSEWGAFLELDLYREALVWAFGGEGVAIQLVPVVRDGALLGHQRVSLHGPDAGFVLTAVTDYPERVEAHQRRFLEHTTLQVLQWINLNRSQIVFTTLLKK